jgi:hypothetical protein
MSPRINAPTEDWGLSHPRRTVVRFGRSGPGGASAGVTTHSFVDESKTPYFLFAAALIPASQVNAARQIVAGFVLPGQRRVHFKSERDSRRAQLMAQFTELSIQAVIYQARDRVNEKAARDRCLTALVRDHMTRRVQRLVIEREESRLHSDRLIIGAEAKDLEFEHLRAHEDPLLAVPDGIAWCWGRGGHWRVKAKHLVTDVIEA